MKFFLCIFAKAKFPFFPMKGNRIHITGSENGTKNDFNLWSNHCCVFNQNTQWLLKFLKNKLNNEKKKKRKEKTPARQQDDAKTEQTS